MNKVYLIFLIIPIFILSFHIEQSTSQRIPDYENPSAPIITDKKIYSWADKMHITIIAPSWNTNQDLVDSIGGEADHAIKISTKSNSLEPYRLTESGPNTGVFSGEVILTGFSHDIDGDGKSDITPRTLGNGPTDGFLETGRDDGLTISFEFADGVVLTKSVSVQWHLAEVLLDKKKYSLDDAAKFRVVDPDMNLNPESVDSISVEVLSDSDSAGIEVDAIETGVATGIFEGNVIFTDTQVSGGDRLFVLPRDIITIKYEDMTLPSPFSISDSKDIVEKAKFGSNMPSIEMMSINELFTADFRGNKIEKISATQPIQIVVGLSNTQSFVQSYSTIIQIKDENSVVREISWVTGQIGPNRSMEISQRWEPEYAGTYDIETFVWDSLNGQVPLSQPNSQKILVNP